MNRNLSITIIVCVSLFLYGAIVSVMVKNGVENVPLIIVSIISAIAFCIISAFCSENIQ
ncbi:hypothetical protein 20Sep420_00033 [Pseudomonas phage 20Sep420]|nr:hypothetical protein 20Sep420_00033 [Pseudomonas phage 20Sep420]